MTDLRREAENLLHEFLCVGGTLEEELDDGGKELELHLCVLILESVQERLEQLVRVIYPLSVLTDDPDHRRAETINTQGNTGPQRTRRVHSHAAKVNVKAALPLTTTYKLWFDFVLLAILKAHARACTNRASGSSRVSRFSQRVEMMLSYLFGYFLKISCKQKQRILVKSRKPHQGFLSRRRIQKRHYRRSVPVFTQYIDYKPLRRACHRLDIILLQN